MMLKQNNSGFTLIEVLVAMAIFAFGVLAVINMQLVATHTNLKARYMTEGIIVAQSKIEELISRNYDHADLKDELEDSSLTVGLKASESLDLLDHKDESHPLYKLGWNVLDDSPFSGTKTVRVVVKWSIKGVAYSFPLDMVKADGS